MQKLLITIEPKSYFATAPKGDTLFGQLCWMLRNAKGEDFLTQALSGYVEGEPFMVLSDAMPSGFVPRPNLPMELFDICEENSDRKAIKKIKWIPSEYLQTPVADWLKHHSEKLKPQVWKSTTTTHNSIDRRTSTTGNGFAPYAVEQQWPEDGARLDIHLLFNSEKIDRETIISAVIDMGSFGFGKDAAIGAGKFTISSISDDIMQKQPDANAMLTLAPSAPQMQGFDNDKSFYTLFHRFGRHGGWAVQTGKVYKNPLLLADSGAVFYCHNSSERVFAGQGIGGNGKLSKAIPETVHQGYAPVIPVKIEV